jgi:hypothetical protein
MAFSLVVEGHTNYDLPSGLSDGKETGNYELDLCDPGEYAIKD